MLRGEDRTRGRRRSPAACAGPRGARPRQPRPGSPGPGVPPAERTALERSAAFRAYARRHEDGLRFLTEHDSPGSLTEPVAAATATGAHAGQTGRRGRQAAAAAPTPRRAAPGRARAEHPEQRPPRRAAPTSRRSERGLLGDLFAIVEEHAARRAPCRSTASRSSAPSSSPASTTPTSGASRARTSSPTRSAWPRSARACASTPRRCAPRCCTTPSRTPAPRSRRCASEFGDEVGQLVDGVTKLTGITFQSRDEAQAENYRKMMVAMATDIRVILIKLADRLHNMRTLAGLPKQKQIEKAKETLDIFAPARAPPRHPRDQVGARGPRLRHRCTRASTRRSRALVNQQREERERYVAEAGRYLTQGARGGRHRRRDLRPRQALLLDLLEDDQEGARVQRDLRPHRHAGASSTR